MARCSENRRQKYYFNFTALQACRLSESKVVLALTRIGFKEALVPSLRVTSIRRCWSGVFELVDVIQARVRTGLISSGGKPVNQTWLVRTKQTTTTCLCWVLYVLPHLILV